MALLQIDASRGSLSSGVRRDRPELGREPRNQVGEFSLPPTDCFQLFDQTGTLAVALVKKPEKSQPEAVLAIDHNVPGGDVGVRTAREGSDAVLIVSNSGPRIPAGEIERLFEPFQRLDGTRTGADGHHGLGLSIVSAIATAHEARLTAVALADGGMSVTVRFAGAAG